MCASVGLGLYITPRKQQGRGRRHRGRCSVTGASRSVCDLFFFGMSLAEGLFLCVFYFLSSWDSGFKCQLYHYKLCDPGQVTVCRYRDQAGRGRCLSCMMERAGSGGRGILLL